MQRIVISSLFIIFVCGTQVFAQFAKHSAKAVRNIKNLDRVLISKTYKGSLPGIKQYFTAWTLPKTGEMLVKVSAYEKTRLTSVFPKITSPVTHDFNYFLQSQGDIAFKTFTPAVWVSLGGKGLYTNQSDLAKDLHALYTKAGYSRRYIGPDGHVVALYVLPINGILYYPAEYKFPVALHPDEYIVIYDLVNQTGKIADNIPAVYSLFHVAKKEEIFGDFEEFEVKPGVYGWRPRSPQKWYEFAKQKAQYDCWYKQVWERKNYPIKFTVKEDLFKALQDIWGHAVPKAKNLKTGVIRYVYELPKKLIYAPRYAPVIQLNPHDYVVLFDDNSRGYIVERAKLENPALYEFVK